jgi:hypothetical protein
MVSSGLKQCNQVLQIDCCSRIHLHTAKCSYYDPVSRNTLNRGPGFKRFKLPDEGIFSLLNRYLQTVYVPDRNRYPFTGRQYASTAEGDTVYTFRVTALY